MTSYNRRGATVSNRGTPEKAIYSKYLPFTQQRNSKEPWLINFAPSSTKIN
jgi:hypothetical protein